MVTDAANSIIYLAGASSEASLVASYMRHLEAAGFAITHDWTVPVLAATRPDAELPEDERAQHARLDVAGIQAARRFWLVVPEAASAGCFVEFGYALGYLGIQTIVSGNWRRCLFTALADHKFESHAEALSFLCPESAHA